MYVFFRSSNGEETSAVLCWDEWRHKFYINSIVKFDTEFVDEGNNLNTGDGIFVAPVSGVYLFSWAIQTRYSQNEETELRVDNIVIIGKQLMSMGSGASYFGTTRNVLCTVSKGNLFGYKQAIFMEIISSMIFAV